MKDDKCNKLLPLLLKTEITSLGTGHVAKGEVRWAGSPINLLRPTSLTIQNINIFTNY